MTPTVLFICGHPPWPPVSGGRRREYEMLLRLRETYRIEVCAVDKEAPPGLPIPIPGGPVAAVAFGPTEPDGGTRLERHHASAPARDWIERRLRRGDIDLIHCEGYFLRQLLPPAIDVPLVIGTQNVEWQLIAQRHRFRSSDFAEVGDRDLILPRAREEEVLREADIVICVTEEDSAALAEVEIETHVVPDGCDHLRRGNGTGRPVDVALIANFAYQPNRDAAEVLCSDVLPELRERRSPVSARLVGNQAAHLLGHLARPDTEVVGPVPSIVDYIADASVITCPLRIGGGIKVKVLEALHAGAAVVCSPVAAQGLADHGGALIVEEDWPRFAMAIGDLLECPDRLAAQRAAARSYARTLPRWDEATTLLDEVWRDTVAAHYGNEVV